jgi:hypothetical protein
MPRARDFLAVSGAPQREHSGTRAQPLPIASKIFLSSAG